MDIFPWFLSQQKAYKTKLHNCYWHIFINYLTGNKMNVLEGQFLLFEIDEKNEDFREIKDIEDPIHTIFNSFSIFIIVDPLDKDIWLWIGKNASIRKKFIATQNAPNIRDSYGVDFKIATIDQGNEPPEFKEIVGL